MPLGDGQENEIFRINRLNRGRSLGHSGGDRPQFPSLPLLPTLAHSLSPDRNMNGRSN